MAMTVNTNMSSLNAQRNMATSQASLSRSMERLSSGLRVNGAKDDAAGLAIAERMNKEIKGMSVAMRNANDGISLAQTADSALGKITDSMQRMRELAVQSANGTYGTADRDNMQLEFTELAEEITRVVEGTKFNNNSLLNSAVVVPSMVFQVGTGATAATDQIEVALKDMTNDLAGVTGGTITGADGTAAQAMLTTLDTAIDAVTTQRGTFGAAQNRFEQAISNLQSSSENVSAARSRIVDADFATESSNMARANILQQASMAMVAQANQAPQQVMKLLQ